jgi:hypothetical protein
MPKIFISYRHIEPDQTLALFLADYFQDNDFSVFIDRQIQTGAIWEEELEKQLRSSDFYVVLLSEESVASPMVRQEIEIAHELFKLRRGTFQLLPVRLNFRDELPFASAAYLNPLQHLFWQTGEAFEQVGENLLTSIRDSIAANDNMTKSPDQLDPRYLVETGAVNAASPFYARRKADEQFDRLIQFQGHTLRVKGPRQVGKSSLLTRIEDLALQRQHKVFYLDFQLSLDKSTLEGLESLLRYLGFKLETHFKTSLKADAAWNNRLGAKDNITNFAEDAVLASTAVPVWFLFDEVDRVFDLPFRDDFFATLRGWHNLRARNRNWGKLNLVFAHSTEPNLWIQNINESPFNVGEELKLADFDLDQIADLNLRYKMPLKSERELRLLFDLVGGNPSLVRRALGTLTVNDWTISKLEEEVASDSGPFGEHLRRFLGFLQTHAELKAAVKQILAGGSCDDEICFQRLNAAGLLRGEVRTNAQMRCNLYRDYFSKHL